MRKGERKQRQYQRPGRKLLFVKKRDVALFWPFSRRLSGPSTVADNERAPLHQRAHTLPLSPSLSLALLLQPLRPSRRPPSIHLLGHDVNRWARGCDLTNEAGLLSIRSSSSPPSARHTPLPLLPWTSRVPRNRWGKSMRQEMWRSRDTQKTMAG